MESVPHIAIACNRLAGSGRSLKLSERIVALLNERNVRYKLFDKSWPNSFNGFTDVWIVGGDGTMNYFINHYPELNLPLVLFKGGTGNDVHWLLYGEQTTEEQVAHVLGAAARPIDAGICNKKLFINGVGIGFEGEVARSTSGRKKLPGKTSFMIAVLKKIFFYRSQLYSIVSQELRIHEKQLMISVTNGKRAGGGFYIAPEAKPDDGLLDLVMIGPLTSVERLRYLPVIENGKHLGLSFVQYHKVKQVTIKSDEIIALHADGEFFPATELNIEVLPGKFNFKY